MTRLVHAKPPAPRKPPREPIRLISRIIRYGRPITDKLAEAASENAMSKESMRQVTNDRP
jgi:hypothetical protein